LKHSTINLLPAVNRAGIPNSNSHKLMSYFNSGKVTLSDFLDDYENADKSLIQLAKDPKEFSTLFSHILKNISTYNNSKKQKLRQEFALSNSYELKIESINQVLFNNEKNSNNTSV